MVRTSLHPRAVPVRISYGWDDGPEERRDVGSSAISTADDDALVTEMYASTGALMPT